MHDKITRDTSRAKKFFENIVSYTLGPYSLKEMIKEHLNEFNIVDVREYDDYEKGHIPYAVHIPYTCLIKNLELVDKDKITVVYTYSDSCPRAYHSACEFADNNYPVKVLRGGFREWKKFDFDIVKTDSNTY